MTLRGTTVLLLPIKTISEANSRDHWTKRRKRFALQAWELYFAWRSVKPTIPPLPIVVTLTRIGPRTLDSDNLAGAFKGLRDQLAKLIGVDDGDPRVEWRYQQQRSGARQRYAVQITVAAA